MTTNRGVEMSPFNAALDRWDRAFDALKRRDYAAYDEITGFKPDSPQEAGAGIETRPGVKP
jgi:hypothetical protein